MESDIALRAGLTTFVFTDIESSTRRWENDPEGMSADLALHDQLLRQVVESLGGEVFSHTGDGMIAAFAHPGSAVAAALEGQRALSSAAWCSRSPLRARMAVHTGPAEHRAGNYFGPTLNRAARLMSTGAGGQVLCSLATVELVGGGLPEGVELVDLGEHRLADLSCSERVFQAVHPDLDSAFPPLRSLGAHRHNLPVALTSFVGRTEELKTLEELLVGNRLITLTGVGGTGKTRLALQVAAGVVERYPDGVWLVELAQIRDEALIAPALAAALGIDIMGMTTADALTNHLVSHLATKYTLLIFDNCEHLIDDAAGFIHQLLTRCPAVTVIATSRENLRVPGEATWRVPTLSLPPAKLQDVADLLDSDAVLFFWERARAAPPGFEPDPANATDVARICRRLDGIPLALELAAARVRVLSVWEVANRLEDSFQLLTSGPRTALPHHQTLRAALDWSHNLLAQNGRTALRQLAIFPAGFAIDAAEAVIRAEPTDTECDPIDLLARLVEQSLVVVAEESAERLRYRMLGPVRQYAWERLTVAGEQGAALRRHRDFFLGLAQEWGNKLFHEERTDRVTADIESFRAALEWSWREGEVEASLHVVTAMWFNWFFGNQTGAREWLERIVDRTRHIAHPARVEALSALAAFSSDDPRRQQTLVEEAVELARRLDDQHGLAALEYIRGEAMLRSGHFAQARGMLESARSRFAQLGYTFGASECQAQLGWVAVGEGDLQLAEAEFRAAVEPADQDRVNVMAQALSALASLVVLDGDPDEGSRLAADAIAAAERHPLRMIQVMALIRAGETAVLAAEPERARQFLLDGLRVIGELGTERYLGDCCELVALLGSSDGDQEAVAVLFGAAAAIHERTGGASRTRFVAQRAQDGRVQLAEILGARRFADCEREGRNLPTDQTIRRITACLQ